MVKVAAEQLWATTYAIKYGKPKTQISVSVWKDLLQQAKAAALDLGAKVILCRIYKKDPPQKLDQVLKDLNFKKTSERIEYKRPLADVPSEEGSPFAWQTAQELEWDLPAVAGFVEKVIKEALDIDPNEKPEDFMQDWFESHDLTFGPQCVAIGFYNSQPGALVVAQVHQESDQGRLKLKQKRLALIYSRDRDEMFGLRRFYEISIGSYYGDFVFFLFIC